MHIQYIDPERYRDLLELTLGDVPEGKVARKDAFFRPLSKTSGSPAVWFTSVRMSDGKVLLCHVPEPGVLILFKPDESSI